MIQTLIIQHRFLPSSLFFLFVSLSYRTIIIDTSFHFPYIFLSRLLADFQSRKAHRVHVRDKDLLKYLLCIVVVVTGYMAAWTAVNIDQVT